MTTLGGNVCIRNGDSLDYCWRECIASLLPVCDTVTVSDGESTDGTQEMIQEWMTREPRLRLCFYPWPDPKGDIDFWVNWLNFCREHVREPFQIQLDADEVLSERSYPIIEAFKRETNPTDRVSLRCHRYNFWKDPQHLIPPGVCCGHRVVRIAPTSVWLPSDGEHPKGAEANLMARNSEIEIMHYGFLRHREAYFKKSRQLHTMFFGGMTDQRMLDVETAAKERSDLLVGENAQGNWMEEIKGIEWKDRIVPFAQPHPEVALPWLRAHGWK